jgi:L-amino acid N-acyltransferase YncA
VIDFQPQQGQLSRRLQRSVFGTFLTLQLTRHFCSNTFGANISAMTIKSLYILAQGDDTPWAIAKLDKHPTSEVTTMESFLVPASSEGDEVTPRHHTDHLHGLTSFLADDMKQCGMTIANGRPLSAHTQIADFAEQHFAANNNILNNAESPTQHKSSQSTVSDMAPPIVQRRRVKYTESSLASAVAPVVIHEQEHKQEHEQQAQPTSESRPPHMIVSTGLPLASSPTITPQRKVITQPLSIEQATAPATTAAQKAPNSDSSSSQPSDLQYTSPTIDSAVDMRYKNRRRHKQARTNEDQEVIFQGRRPGNPSNATTSAKRYDSANGISAGKAGGEADRPALAAKSNNQTTSNKPQSSTTGQSPWRPHPMKNQAIQESKPNPPDNSWDTGHPPLPGNARINGGSPNKPLHYNGRVPIDRKPHRKPRESPWIKDNLIPKGDSKRHQARWTSSSDEDSPPDSNRASSGWGTRRRKDEGAALGDWSGGMAPALIDWDSRAPFKDQQTEAKIDKWLANVASALAHVDQVSFTDGAKTFSFTKTSLDERGRGLIPEERGDVVPRYWIPTLAEGDTIAVFWVSHISRESKPRPVHEDDLDLAKPWWQRYVDSKSCMLQGYDHPWIAGNDPEETEEERLAREFDNGGLTAGVNRKAAEKAKRDAERKGRLARVANAHKFAGARTSSAVSAMPNSIKPGLNHLFLRSATKPDMIQLRDMYNRYIDNTFVVPETTRRTESDMLNRLQASRDAKLPFIVACQRGEVVKARNKKQNGGEDMVMSDRVVGFAYAVDWVNEEQSIYRATVQMEVFVDMDHYTKNIGSCLVDKTMVLLDPSVVERGGYETVGEELDGIGPSKVVSNVMIRYSYDAQNTDKLAWVSEWLNRRLGFQKVADLQGVAQKFDKK